MGNRVIDISWPRVEIDSDIGGESIIPPGFKGVVAITGLRGSGKTTFSLADDPKKTMFWDGEKKGEGFHDTLQFGSYVDIPTEVAMVMGNNYSTEIIYDRTQTIIGELPKDRFSTIIFDNIQPLISGMVTKLQNDELLQVAYGIKPKNAATGSIGGVWPGVSQMFKRLVIGCARVGIKVVVVVAHAGEPWVEGKPVPNKFQMTQLKGIHELSILTAVMLPMDPARDKALHESLGVEAGHPVAGVIKESLGRTEWDKVEKRYRTIRRIPPRISPGALWRVYNYMNHPPDFNNLEPHQVWGLEEASPWSPVMSREQISFIKHLAILSKSQMDDRIRELAERSGEEGG